jgi:transposase-like protein
VPEVRRVAGHQANQEAMSDVLDRHSRMPRKYLATGEEQPKDAEGKFDCIPLERKAACLADVKPMLLEGATLDQIAQKHQVHPRTLDFWLAQMPEEYREIRKQWIDYKLTDAEERMVNAPDPFQLAKGRELARLAMWRAERRDPERYADKRELTVKHDEPQTPEAIREKINTLEQRLGVKTITVEPA